MLQETSRFQRLLIDYLIPLLIVILSGGVFRYLGSASATKRPPIDGSREARLEALPPADVEACKSFEELGGILDLKATGSVVPFREVQQAAEVSGRIVFKSPQCQTGSIVRKGELLLRIDATDYKLEIERLEKQREQDQQLIRELEQELINSANLLKIADEEVALQDQELKRLQKLPAGFVSDTEIERVKGARLSAQNRKVQTENQQELLRQRRTRLEATVALTETQLKRAQYDLSRAEIFASCDGLIATENVELHSFVQRGSPVVTIVETGQVEVVVDLKMDQLHWILDQVKDSYLSPGDPRSLGEVAAQSEPYLLPKTPVTLEYRVSGRENDVYQWQGHLERFDGAGLNLRTRMAPVRIVVEHPEEGSQRSLSDKGEGRGLTRVPVALMRGMFVDVIFHLRPRSELVAVPLLAFKPGGQVWKFIQDDGVLDIPLPGEKSVVEEMTENHDKGNGVKAEGRSYEKEKGQDKKLSTLVNAAGSFDAGAWQAGRIEVVNGVRPVSSIGKYWICEIPEGKLLAGDPLIVTPLSGVGSGGSEVVRVPAAQPKVASTEANQR